MEFVANKFIKIIFVRSEDNKSDILTKNVSSDVYQAHVDEYVVDKDEFLNTPKRDSNSMTPWRWIAGRVLGIQSHFMV